MVKEIVVKVHKTYRLVIAVCDSELVGRKLEEGIKQLDLSTNFFKGEPVSYEELNKFIEKGSYEDATFYIVGPKSISFSKKKGLISDKGILKIEGVPYALILL